MYDLNSASGSGEASLEALALKHTTNDFYQPKGPDLLARTQDYYEWVQARKSTETWQYTRILETFPGTSAKLRDTDGRSVNGINFSSQDYLSLGAHPKVHEAAKEIIGQFGPHSAGSPMIIGNTSTSMILEEELADFLKTEHVLLFPTGWAAGFGAIVGLVRSYDHIVMDRLSHACLQIGARSATTNLYKHAHLDAEAARKVLSEIRTKDHRGGILVITEGLFSMDADSPDLTRLQETCHEYGATLMVDIAHDLGSMGPQGTGRIGVENLLGKVDVVMGSFSKSFASNGGFVATQAASVKEHLKMFCNSHLFSNALSPVQAAVALTALRIIRSSEGDALREQLFSAIRALRSAFENHGIACYGNPSPIVPVPIGDERLARIVYRKLRQKNVAAMIIEHPIVPLGSARFRLQVMAHHTPSEAQEAAEVIVEAMEESKEYLNENYQPL